ncbi:hypothetical protein AURDEDRAFT_116601 [Auricularia subglabra TFB-10046 SS5]|nr:hypothetical protein AURDEDRAFT_116601 [Auricularia subglabra TFB-10046 SS5]
MPSIFSRSKSSSAASHAVSNGRADEFGRVDSRGSATAAKKDSKKLPARLRTFSTPTEPTDYSKDEPVLPPDGSFLPLSLSPPDHGDHSEPLLDYGYLFYEKEIVLGVEDVARLVQVVGAEIALRGLTTPLLFSTLALDVSLPFIKRIISAFLRTCPYVAASAEAKARWLDEARVASPHDLAMTLRWALARIVRIERAQESRGLLSMEYYSRWRAAESTARFPADFFAVFRDGIDNPDVRTLFDALFALLSRLTANSNSSGLTPQTLASLFGPLLFGLGSSSGTFQLAYHNYLRASHATEHLLLAYIRSGGNNLPPRLADWVRGYPAMLPSTSQLDSARRGARTVRVLAVRRNVRMYTSDLVRNGASWQLPPTSKEWNKVTANDTRAPRYSDAFRKRLNLAVSFTPESTDTKKPQADADSVVESERFRSLTDLKWGEFEALGFGTPDETKLQFDLTESARKARLEKHKTLTWNDFSTAGFSRSDAPLSATLQFSAPIAATIGNMSAQQAELHRKLKKAQRALPPFGWDTKPVLGAEEVVEEAFLDVFCDLIWSAGWQDRREQTFRDCNWAMVEYKALAASRGNSRSPNADPRTGSQLVLYEEFVPSEYRAQLTAPKRRLRLPFAARSQRQWKPAQTLNGRPYAIGSVPRSPSQRELDFENMLNDKSGVLTKVLSASGAVRSASPPLPPVPKKAGVNPSVQIVLPEKGKRTPSPNAPAPAPAPGAGETTSPLFARTALAGSRFRVGKRREGIALIPSQYDSIEFETRETDDLTDDDMPTHERRKSRDDAWVDILVASGSRRMPGQDADLPPPGSRRRLVGGIGGGRGNRSDPELAREEVERVLAQAGRRPSEDEDALRYGEPEPSAPEPPQFSAVRDSVDSIDFEPVHVRTASTEAALPDVPETPRDFGDEEEVHRGSMYSEAESEDSVLTPPQVPVDPDSGRNSPGRYVHGQPLHNVLEEEEEP